MDKNILDMLMNADLPEEMRNRIIKGQSDLKEKLKSLIFHEHYSKENISKIIRYSNSLDRMGNYILYIQQHPEIPDKDYWESLAVAYSISDNLFRHQLEVKNLFSSERTQRKYLMSPYERHKLNKLPSKIKIYRGMTGDEADAGNISVSNYGISWTLSKKVAEYFAYTYPRNFDTLSKEKIVISLEVDKRSILAYFSQRREQEVIYIP